MKANKLPFQVWILTFAIGTAEFIIAGVLKDVAGISKHLLIPLLILVGFGLLVGNNFGGKAADKDLDRLLIAGAVFMIMSMVVLGFVDTSYYLFWIFAFILGIGTFFNVPSMQMNVMRYGLEHLN